MDCFLVSSSITDRDLGFSVRYNSLVFEFGFACFVLDGLARSEAGGVLDADYTASTLRGGFLCWLCNGIVSNSDPNLLWRSGSRSIGYGPQFALV